MGELGRDEAASKYISPNCGQAVFFTFRSPLAVGMPCDVVFPLTAVRAVHMNAPLVKAQVFRKVMALFDWSIRLCECGVGPSRGYYGEDLGRTPKDGIRFRIMNQIMSGGYTACYTGIKHDTKAKMEIHNEKQYWSCNWICMSCFACKPSVNTCTALIYGNFRKDAPWRGTQLNNESFELYWDASERGPVFQIRGHCHEMSYWDWMHVVALGILRDHCANHIWAWISLALFQEASVEHTHTRIYLFQGTQLVQHSWAALEKLGGA